MTLTAADYVKLPYTVTIQADGDGGYVARIAELPGCIADGETESEALEAVREVQAAWIEEAIRIGKPIPQPVNERTTLSGKWLQRVSKTLHRKLADLAATESVSLNQLVATILAEAVGERRAAVKPLESYLASAHAHVLPLGYQCLWQSNVVWKNSNPIGKLDAAYAQLLYGQLAREITGTEEFNVVEIVRPEPEHRDIRGLPEGGPARTDRAGGIRRPH